MSVEFSSTMTKRSYSWSAFKTALGSRRANLQYDESLTDYYLIWFYDGPEVHTCVIWKDTVPQDIADAGLSQASNDSAKADFETTWKPKGNRPVELRDSQGRALGTYEKPTTGKVTTFSFDWTNPTTWVEKSVRVVDEVATDSGDHLTYTLSHTNIIDTYHGLITGEDYLKSSAGNSLRVSVKVNGTAKTEVDPHSDAGHYTVDYRNGTLTFGSALDPADVVTVTYHYANGSTLTIKPATGKTLKIEVVEVQFSADIELTDTAIFQPYGYVDVFAPQYLQSNGGPYPSKTLIPLGNPIVYKTIRDYMNDSLRSYPAYPEMGGATWRGLSCATHVFDWDYLRSTSLSSAAGMEIRVSLQHDIPFNGTYATASFYCATEDEV